MGWCLISSISTGSTRSNSCRIARQAWPAHLQEIGKIEPAARRDLLISAEAKRLTRIMKVR